MLRSLNTRFLAALLAAALLSIAFVPAHAQSMGANLSGQASAANEGNNQNLTVNTTAPDRQTIHYEGSQTIKTTGQAYAPTIQNSSGVYTCFGGASAGVGVAGFALAGGGTISQAECYRLHLMDKAANRVAAANQSGDSKTATAYAKVWDAGFCQFADGKAMYEAAGMTCPQEAAKQAAAAQVDEERRRVATGITAPTPVAAAGWTGANPNDEFVAMRAAAKGVTFTAGYANK